MKALEMTPPLASYIEAKQKKEEEQKEKVNRLIPDVKNLAPTDEYIASARLTPKCFISDYLYADVGTIIAPGGTGKTTLLLHEAACLALGRSVWGNKCIEPGWTLLITGEDQYERLIARLREICKGMDLDAAETRIVFDNVIIHDVSSVDGHGLTRLMDGNIIQTEFADHIITGCMRREPPASIVIDPMISFGASEALVNDNEQKLVDAGRIIVAALECCVRYVHHSGKALDRVADGNQYAGRGGSAMPDGCRMVTILAAYNEHDKPNGQRQSKPPAGCVQGPGVSLTVLHRSKQSYSPPNLPKTWIRREGHSYEHFFEFAVPPDQQARAFEDQIVRYVTSQLSEGRYMTLRSLRAICDQIGMTQREVVAAVEGAESCGKLVNHPLPRRMAHGARKTFLCPPDWTKPDNFDA